MDFAWSPEQEAIGETARRFSAASLRDVLGLQIGDGTAQIIKLIIAREKAGRLAVPY